MALVGWSLIGVPAWRDAIWSDNDFPFIWGGPAVWLHGVNPYDPQQWPDAPERLGASGHREAVYDYPPWTTLALVPIGALPLQAAAAVWAYGGLALAIVAMGLLAREYLQRVPLAAMAVGFLLIVSQPAIQNFFDGEFSLVLLAGLVAVALGLGQRRQTWGAIGLLALALKPTPFAIAFPAILRAAVVRAQWRFVAIVAAAGALSLVVSFVVFPGWLGNYLAVIQQSRLGNAKTTVLPFALRELFGAPGLVLGVAVLLVLVALALRFDPHGDAYVGAWSAVAPLLTPYLHSYDQLVILVPLVIAIGTLARRSVRLAYGLVVFALLDLVLVAPLLINDAGIALGRETLNAFVIVPLSMLIVAALWRDRASPASSLRPAGGGDPYAAAPIRR
jgi:hypothetical protein